MIAGGHSVIYSTDAIAERALREYGTCFERRVLNERRFWPGCSASNGQQKNIETFCSKHLRPFRKNI